MEGVGMSAAAAISPELLDDLHQHTANYPSTAKAAILELADMWAELETPCDVQHQELADVLKAVRDCWAGAVSSVHQRQQAVRDAIQHMLAEMMQTKEALGTAADPAAEAELARLQGSRSAHKTLRAWEQDVFLQSKYWQRQKLARVAEYEELQARIGVLRRLCGLAPLPGCIKPDITSSNIQFLRLEQERLAVEKAPSLDPGMHHTWLLKQQQERREDLLRRLLGGLAEVCGDIGEDHKAAAAEVHASLSYIWDEEASRVVRDMYRLSSSYATSGGAPVDLSDTTISRLSSKLQAMKDLRSARATHAAEVLGVLHSLWDATAVPPEERAHYVKLMAGSLRLHARSLEKCQAAVHRLEHLQLQQMLDLINARADELRSLCADSHVAEPAGLAEALQAVNDDTRNPGAAADLLAKLCAMLGEVKVLTGKRAAIIGAIREVQAAVAEDAWLEDYEADEGRYKGRDANRKLQRAIRAKKLREHLPGMLSEVRERLAEWRGSEGAPFTYDGRDYEFEVLDVLQAEVEEAAAARAAKAARSASARRQSISSGGAPPAAGLLSPGTGAAPRRSTHGGAGGVGPPPRPSSACGDQGSPGVRRAGGPGTPMPLRGVSSRSLSERHSICVIRPEPGAAATGSSTALSRSGRLALMASAAGLVVLQAAGQTRHLRQTRTGTPAKAAPQLPVRTVRTANTILDELGVLQELPQEVLPELIAKTVVRRGKGGRQKQVDPLLDPRFAGLEPSKVARIMANREAAARSKLKAKLLKEACWVQELSTNSSMQQSALRVYCLHEHSRGGRVLFSCRCNKTSGGQEDNTCTAPAEGPAPVGGHRSKRKRHMTSRAAEAAAAGLIPTAGLSPEEALAAAAAHSAMLVAQQQQQPRVLGRGPAAAAAAAACGGDDLSRQIHTEVQLLSSIDKATVMEALERLFRLLASLLLSGDARAGDALALALAGLLGLLRCSSSSRDGGGWSDLQLTALAVLDSLARQAPAYRDCVVACGAPVVLVRLLEAAGSAAVQLAAVQALQALLQHGSVSTVEAVADAHGVEVLLLAVARGKAGSALREAAAACLCSMAELHPGHGEVAVAAAGGHRLLVVVALLAAVTVTVSQSPQRALSAASACLCCRIQGREAIASVRLQGLYYHDIRATALGRYLVEQLGPPPLGEHEGQLPVQLMRWVTLRRAADLQAQLQLRGAGGRSAKGAAACVAWCCVDSSAGCQPDHELAPPAPAPAVPGGSGQGGKEGSDVESEVTEEEESELMEESEEEVTEEGESEEGEERPVVVARRTRQAVRAQRERRAGARRERRRQSQRQLAAVGSSRLRACGRFNNGIVVVLMSCASCCWFAAQEQGCAAGAGHAPPDATPELQEQPLPGLKQEVSLLGSSDLGVVMDALDWLFRLLASLVESGDARADEAMASALQGLVQLLGRQHGGSGANSKGWAEVQLTTLTVLQAMAQQSAAYRESITAAGAVMPLLRLIEGASCGAVQVAAVQALQALVVPGGVGCSVWADAAAALQQLEGGLSPGGELWAGIGACLASIAAAQ
ncbi:microtubule associated protein-domain-containing protein [Scenedesmus sp. NREL 46B-D3]|nr:microtubule associated protein-domain-containing protein [Scenedesmus sp. NREL 46B-D3]